MSSFLGEIKRRKVFQVAAVYVVVAWLIIQVVDVVNEPLSLPDWFDTVVILLLAMGFPIALLMSWAFDLTSKGVVRDPRTTLRRGGRIGVVLVASLVVAVGWIGYREFNPPMPEQRALLPNSVAVLPLENLSLDPENAFFAAGIHDTILNELAKIADLNVIARTSVLRYADGQTPVAQIAQELNVETIMEGTVQYADGQMRITAQLIDPETGSHLWSENYDRPFADIFAIQSEIATRIAEALEAELLPDEQRSIEAPATASNAAYVLFLRAKAPIYNLGPFLPTEFYENLNQALVIDPDFALAHATLAFAYARALGFGEAVRVAGSAEEHERLVVQHAARAREIDSDQGLALAALAMLDDAYARQADAERNWNQAVELNPSDPEVLDDAVIFFGLAGQTERANELFERLAALDPAGWGAPYYIAFGARDYEGAASVMRDWIRANPGIGIGIENLVLGVAEAIRGERDTALDQLTLAEQLRPRLSAFELSQLAYSYGRIGRGSDAHRMLGQLQSLAEAEGFSEEAWPHLFAFAYLGTGENTEALRWLETWAEAPGPRGGPGVARALVARNLLDDPVLEQPEFIELRRRLGFED